MKRKFNVKFELDGWEVSNGIIELDQKVIDVVDDEWRKELYSSLTTPEKIAAHIAYGMCIHNANLTSMDGWADLDNSFAKIIVWPQGLDDFDVIATEIKD